MNQRRLEGRFLCADLVRLDWVSGEGAPMTVEAVLEDISAVGACVQVEEAIPQGVAISMSGGSGPLHSDQLHTDADAHFSGIVSYCVFRDYGYFIGIRLSDDTKWSSGVYEPQHLTNLAELATSQE